MARSSRIPRKLPELLAALDHHQFLLRQSMHGLREDQAHVKILASELRTLICKSSGTEGLLWRIVDELNVSDVVPLQAGGSVNRDHPQARGLTIAKIPLWRPGEGPPGLPVEYHRLRDIIKEDEAIYVAQLKDQIFTHELLIGAIAGQMGGAHEAEGLGYSLVQLNRLLVNRKQLYFHVLAYDAELTLQIGERVLDHVEEHNGFRRARRPADYGDVTLLIRFARRQPILGRVPIITYQCPVAEAAISCSAYPKSTHFTLEKRGTTVAELEVPYPPEWNEDTDAVFAVSYSTAHKQARTITNNQVSNGSVPCNFGWLDARELRQPQPHAGFETFIAVRGALVYGRLLSPKKCGEHLRIWPDMRQLMLQERPADPFPS